MQVNLSMSDLMELLAKHKAGEPVTLDDGADEVRVHIPAAELPALLKGSPAEGRAIIDRLGNNRLDLKVVDPVKTSVTLSDFRLHGDRVSAQTNLNFVVRKAVDMFLRAKSIKRAYLDDKRVVILIPPRVRQMVELTGVTVAADGVTVTGKLKQLS